MKKSLYVFLGISVFLNACSSDLEEMHTSDDFIKEIIGVR